MRKQFLSMAAALAILSACGGQKQTSAEAEKFDYTVEQFADLQILRYRVPGFEQLSLQQKQLVYYLTEAALQGRDILFDQNGKYNLRIRKALEAVYTGYKGDKQSADFKALEVYLKRVWFSNGIHHHYGCEKFVPGFTPEFFKQALASVDASELPLAEGQTLEQFCDEIFPVIFDPAVMPKRERPEGSQGRNARFLWTKQPFGEGKRPCSGKGMEGGRTLRPGSRENCLLVEES